MTGSTDCVRHGVTVYTSGIPTGRVGAITCPYVESPISRRYTFRIPEGKINFCVKSSAHTYSSGNMNTDIFCQSDNLYRGCTLREGVKVF